MSDEKHLFRGVLAGVAGGLVASWVMNEFVAGPGKQLKESLQSDGEKEQEAEQQKQQEAGGQPQDDATMKTADAVAGVATGEHLSREQKEKAGPIVHYAFGAIMGGIYGGLAEYSTTVTSGFGTTFGGTLFAGADLLAVPALRLSPAVADQPSSALATPFAAHLVYGATSELVRRIVRAIL